MQTRKGSLVEILSNIGVKFFTAVMIWEVLRPWLVLQNGVTVTMVFTVNSFIFGYLIRRIFNRRKV